MLYNYLKSINRSLFRNRIYTFFSIISLTLGLLCSIYAYLYISHETSYDEFFENADRIVRLQYQFSFGTGELTDYATMPSRTLPDQWVSLNVSAVMQNVPSNSHFKFSYLISEAAFEDLYEIKFSDVSVAYQYFLLSPGANKKVIESKLNRLWNEAHQKYKEQTKFHLQALTGIRGMKFTYGEIKRISEKKFYWLTSRYYIY